MSDYFTKERVKDLTENHNWEIAESGNNLVHLRQKDKHYMKTVDFKLPEPTCEGE